MYKVSLKTFSIQISHLFFVIKLEREKKNWILIKVLKQNYNKMLHLMFQFIKLLLLL